MARRAVLLDRHGPSRGDGNTEGIKPIDYYHKPRKGSEMTSPIYERATIAFWVIAAILLAASFGVGFINFAYIAQVKAGILALWTVGVPLYFMVDYVYWHPIKRTSDPLEFDKFKHSHELGFKFWLAVLTVLAFLYFDDGKIHFRKPTIEQTKSGAP